MLSRTDQGLCSRELARAIVEALPYCRGGDDFGVRRITLAELCDRHHAPRAQKASLCIRNCPVTVTQQILNALWQRCPDEEFLDCDAYQLADGMKVVCYDEQSRRRPATLVIYWPPTAFKPVEVAHGA